MARRQYRSDDIFVPAQPFVDWLHKQRERILADETLSDQIGHNRYGRGQGHRVLAERLGITDRALRRYMKCLDGNNAPTDTFQRRRVEDMLERMGLRLHDVGIHDDIELEPDTYCPVCREDVTPIDGNCPWHAKRGGRKPKNGYQRPRGLCKTRATQLLSDERLLLLHRIHVRWSIPIYELARRIWSKQGYASPASCDEAIRRGWKRLGLQCLPHSQIMRAVAAQTDKKAA